MDLDFRSEEVRKQLQGATTYVVPLVPNPVWNGDESPVTLLKLS
jgi:hypothetical protein